MTLTIVTVGKKHESWVLKGVERYEKRLRQPFDVKWILLPHSSFEDDRARQEESERIESRLKSSDFVILLDERGKNIDSPTLATLLGEQLDRSVTVTLIIGGAFGVTEALYHRANVVWSLSKLVFPHQLVRLIVMEQLYRTQTIRQGGKYHHV